MIFDYINEKRLIHTRNHGEFPDNVMIHLVHKNTMYRYQSKLFGLTWKHDKMTHCFGMRIIWTDCIDEEEIICTYNGK